MALLVSPSLCRASNGTIAVVPLGMMGKTGVFLTAWMQRAPIKSGRQRQLLLRKGSYWLLLWLRGATYLRTATSKHHLNNFYEIFG